MAPRITLHNSASANSSSSRAWNTLAQHTEDAHARADMDVDVQDEMSEMDEQSPEEIDELDESDTGAQDPPQPHWEVISSVSAAASPSKPLVKRPRAKPPTTRVPGQTIVPMSRVEAILSADTSQKWAPSKEASYLISLATEEFIRRLTRAAHSRSRLDKRALTTYNDIADTAYYFEEYKFLQEMIPRPLSPRSALAERKRILEDQEALLHGVGVDGAQPESTNKYSFGQLSGSASTSKASTPVPRLTKVRKAPSTSANGKASSKSKNSPSDTSTPVIRSERQKSKQARLASEAHAAAEAGAGGNIAPPPSPAVVRYNPDDGGAVNGSTSSGKSGGMKIKIRPRIVSATPSTVPVNAAYTGRPLIPSLKISSAEALEREALQRSRSVSQKLEDVESDGSFTFEEDVKSGTTNGRANGKTGNVQFAPVGVDATDQPLWTRVPLPPPPSAKTSKPRDAQDDSKHRSMLTDLDSIAEQTRLSRESKARSVLDRERSPDLPQDELKPIENGRVHDLDAPPAKRPRQRQHSGESTLSKGSARDALNGTFPNTGRTIYSQR